jgi:hypothetical protein
MGISKGGQPTVVPTVEKGWSLGSVSALFAENPFNLYLP